MQTRQVQTIAVDSHSDSAYVPAATVAALYGVSIATVWRWSRSGAIPKPRKFGPMTTRWNLGELRASLSATKANG